MNRTAVNFDPEILKRQGKKRGSERERGNETYCRPATETLYHMGLRDVVQQLRARRSVPLRFRGILGRARLIGAIVGDYHTRYSRCKIVTF